MAGAYKLKAWELLIDRQAEKERLMGRIFGRATSDESMGDGWAAPTDEAPKSIPSRKK